MARKQKHEEHENHERWLVSYADFITLLFAFFVVMYSLSSVNEGKYRVLSESLVAAFRNPPKSLDPIQMGNPLQSPPLPSQENVKAPDKPGPSPPIALPLAKPRQPDQPEVDPQARRQQEEMGRAKVIEEMANEMEQALSSLIEKDLVNVHTSKFWMEVEMKSSILFPSGSAAVSPTAIATLDKVAAILRRYPNPIHVEGFTDNQPIRTQAFPSNWELSAARAASVVRLFSRAGVDPSRMAAVGYGEHQPKADNKTAEGRNANRRVVLVILADPSSRRLRDEARSAPELPAAGTTP